jgi:hypothetical protein
MALFPERQAYETYLRYCRMLRHPYPPMDFETWKAESSRIFRSGSSHETKRLSF